MSMRWCTTAVRSAAVGLAVPMSMPQYTSAESTLMISASRAWASASAAALLPLAVGPARAMVTGEARDGMRTSVAERRLHTIARSAMAARERALRAPGIMLMGEPLADGRLPAVCAPLVARTHAALLAEAA